MEIITAIIEWFKSLMALFSNFIEGWDDFGGNFGFEDATL